jgi:hypothetical protein
MMNHEHKITKGGDGDEVEMYRSAPELSDVSCASTRVTSSVFDRAILTRSSASETASISVGSR